MQQTLFKTEQPQEVSGQVQRLEGKPDCVLLQGNCLEKLKGIPDNSIDAIVTDPPFAFAGGLSNGLASRTDSQFFVHWLSSVFEEMHRVSKPESAWFLWADWRSLGAYEQALSNGDDYYNRRKISQVIIHDREMIGMGSPFRSQVDYIALVRGKKTKFDTTKIPKNHPNIIRSYWYYGKHKHHPAEKCPDIAKKLVEFITPNNGIVLDPFMGSGTTGVACNNLNLKFIGIELDEKYYQIAKKRLKNSTAQLSLF